jgi:hypothetical protein
MAKISTFRRGFGSRPGGTYECGECGRLTRRTVEGQTHLCGQCDERTMIENAINDGNYSGLPAEDLAKAEAEILRLKQEAAKRGGSRERLGL